MGQQLAIRLGTVEQTLERLAPSLENIVNDFNRRIGATEEVVRALVMVVGEDAVNEVMVSSRKTEHLQKQEQAKGALQVALAEGRLQSTDKVTEETLVVLDSFNADGTKADLGTVQTYVRQLPTSVGPSLLGQSVGGDVVLEDADGIKLVIKAIYEPAPQPEPTSEVPSETTDEPATVLE